MNIAFVGNFSLNAVNGVSYSGYQVARYLSLLKNNIFIYNFSEIPMSTRHESGITERTFAYSIKKLGWSNAFVSFLKGNPDQIEVFHLHSVFTPYNFITSMLLKSLRFPYVLSAHGGYCKPVLSKNKLYKILYMTLFERYVVKNAHGMVAVSDQEVQDLRDVGYGGIIRVIPNPVVVNNFRCHKAEKKELISLLYLGRYDIQHKGLNFLLDTFKLLSSRRPDVRLTLYGDGPDKDALLRRIDAENIQHVKVLGPVFGEEKECALQHATLFIQPSKWEVFGISLIEAMMLGRPVALTEGCYLSATLRRNGLGLIIPFDPEKAAKLIQNYLEAGPLVEDGRKNKIFAIHEFELDKIARQILGFYSLLSKKSVNSFMQSLN